MKSVPEHSLCMGAPLSQLSHMVTAFVSSGPRPGDSGICSVALVDLLHQLRKLLPHAPIVVVFDAPRPAHTRPTSAFDVQDKGNTTQSRLDYSMKISRARLLPDPLLRVIEFERWMHQGEALREGMRACTTPLVFSAQDDIQLVALETIQVDMIVQRLLCDQMVEYVRLYWGDVLKPSKFGVQVSGEHPSQPGLLSTPEWSDRPHFARVATYRDRVWPLFWEGRKEFPEIAVMQHLRTASPNHPWALWAFAPNCSMLHERHHRCGHRRSRNPSYG